MFLRSLSTVQLFGYAITLRMILIAYGLVHDAFFDVRYTDVDFDVVNDAAGFMIQGRSPFERVTYRYTPLLALLLVPGHLFPFLNSIYGKFLFSVCDVLVGYVLWRALSKHRHANLYVATYLFNPLIINVCTRGNGDAIAGLLMVLTLHTFLQRRWLLSSILFGSVIHWRIFPIILASLFLFSPVLTLRQKFYATMVSALTFLSITGFFYKAYGDQCLYESLLYHFVRTDHRHNLSPYFLMYYLDPTPGSTNVTLLTALPSLFQMALLGIISYRCRKDVYAGAFFLILTFVAFNKVQTVQYFNWYLTFLPLMIPKFQRTVKNPLFFSAQLLVPWFISFIIWSQFAYFYEFKAFGSLIPVWCASLALFVAYLHIIARLWLVLAPQIVTGSLAWD